MSSVSGRQSSLGRSARDCSLFLCGGYVVALPAHLSLQCLPASGRLRHATRPFEEGELRDRWGHGHLQEREQREEAQAQAEFEYREQQEAKRAGLPEVVSNRMISMCTSFPAVARFA
jgi:hypothetical protein